jgi:hypothetical protein
VTVISLASRRLEVRKLGGYVYLGKVAALTPTQAQLFAEKLLDLLQFGGQEGVFGWTLSFDEEVVEIDFVTDKARLSHAEALDLTYAVADAVLPGEASC